MTDLGRSGTLGVVGLGAMGTPMVRRALGAGTPVRITGRSRERAADSERAGAVWVDTPRGLAETAAVVLLMVPDLPQVEELLAGQDGLLQGSDPLILAIGATVSPVRVRALGDRLVAQTDGRVQVVDCPVSGGVEGAAEGTLSIMMGGEASAVEAVAGVLTGMGRTVHLGPLGSGAVAKTCNQMIVGATVLALGEAVVMAERAGLELRALLDVLGGGYAGSRVLETRAGRFVKHDHTPSGAAKYMAKDLGFAADLAAATGTSAVGLPAVRVAFEELVAAGLGDLDLAVVQRFIEQR